ncbi:hypothetical protein CVT24_007877 [Panaeolus cyanescens]|uniref:Uncharacterized protein n=1 Tax=Panaeolus cyanescens TaxID=181874 RepID=A0A409WRM1_9AGAR|nr:hypothetical protein CVT24_007877 [Panaeolus cyanescens]
MPSSKKNHRVSQKKFYLKNLEDERLKARLRSQRNRSKETPEAALIRKQKHREAQARYRAKNKLVLKTQSWQYRMDKKWRQAKEKDEQEYQAMLRDMDPQTRAVFL